MRTLVSHSETDRRFIYSLARGLELLRYFCEDKTYLGLTEISKGMNLSKATVSRFLYTLHNLGYLEKNVETKKYRLSPKVLYLGYSFLKNFDLGHLAYPYLKGMAEEVNETVNLSILDETEIIFIERIEKKQIISMKLQVGSKLPAYCTSMGKVLLASLPDEKIDEILRKSRIEKHTINTNTDIKDIKKELIGVRLKGFSLNDEELTMGLRSIAAPVKSESRETTAAVNISVPSARMTIRELEKKFLKTLIETTNKISAILGYPE